MQAAQYAVAAWRVIRGINSPNFGMVYVASHTFHMQEAPMDIMRTVGDRIGIVHVSDTMDHNASHGLRYITNPPGNAVRVHQHLKIGDGDVNWDEFFSGLKEIGFLDRDDTVMCSSVFAENATNRETAIYQREAMKDTSRRSTNQPCPLARPSGATVFRSRQCRTRTTPHHGGDRGGCGRRALLREGLVPGVGRALVSPP